MRLWYRFWIVLGREGWGERSWQSYADKVRLFFFFLIFRKRCTDLLCGRHGFVKGIKKKKFYFYTIRSVKKKNKKKYNTINGTVTRKGIGYGWFFFCPFTFFFYRWNSGDFLHVIETRPITIRPFAVDQNYLTFLPTRQVYVYEKNYNYTCIECPFKTYPDGYKIYFNMFVWLPIRNEVVKILLIFFLFAFVIKETFVGRRTVIFRRNFNGARFCMYLDAERDTHVRLRL